MCNVLLLLCIALVVSQERRDLPCGRVVGILPSNGGDMCSIAVQGTRFLHTAEQLGLCAITREARVTQ